MKTNKSLPYLILIIAINIVLISLMWMDHKTTSWSQIFPNGILFMWLIYGLPLLIILVLIFLFLEKKLDTWLSMIFTIMFGTPFITALIVLTYKLIL